MAAEIETHPARRRQLLDVRFYLREMLLSVESNWLSTTYYETNYLSLLDDLQPLATNGQDVVIVSFNYDTLLDQAIKRKGLNPLADLDHFLKGAVRLYKVHGSLTWWRRLVGGPFDRPDHPGSPDDAVRIISERIQEGRMTDDYLPGLPSPWFDGKWFVPAIAVPIAQKDSFECPPAHVERLATELPRVTRVVTIGWKGADDHFLHILRAVPDATACLIVAGSATAGVEVVANFERCGLSFKNRVYDGGFSQLVSRRDLRQFLAER